MYKYTTGHLLEGINKVRLVSINAEGAPNLDHLMVKLDTNKYFGINLTILGDGSVDFNPAADSFLYGTRVKLTPTADSGFAFSNWSGDFTGSANPLAFTVDREYSIEANFSNISPAFPGAEGFGGNVTGGRGGAVYEVINLNDDGSGSLRAAIEAAEARTIVFRVSGTIQLESNLSIASGDLTIAGQTAPGGGITLAGYPLKVGADNVIIRFIRSRLGDVHEVADDAMNGSNNQGVIIDHCTMSWSVDECGSFYDNTDFTMQYCLLSESLWHSVHPKGDHGYGGIWGGKGASFHHNLFAHHTSRTPRFCGSRYSVRPDLELVDFRNNVIFNWGFNNVYGAEGGRYNIINNYYKSGPATGSSVRSRIINPNADVGDDAQEAGVWGVLYVDGNYVNGYDAVTENNWAGVHANITDLSEIRSDVEYECDSVTTYNAEIAFEHVLAQVGVVLPERDTLDKRIISETISGVPLFGSTYGEGRGIIDSQADVGGWPVLASGTPPADTDHDGMPDEWETARGLNISDPSDRNGDDDVDGYTNLEEYLNELVAEYTYIIRPLHFAVTSYDQTEINLGWDELEEATGYLLERKLEDEDDYTQLTELAAGQTSYTDAVSYSGRYDYRLRSFNDSDTSLYTYAFAEVLLGIDSHWNAGTDIRLAPNPFNKELTLNIELSESRTLNISLIDITGRTRKILYQDRLTAGTHRMSWDLAYLPEGLYCFILDTGEKRFLRKIVKM